MYGIHMGPVVGSCKRGDELSFSTKVIRLQRSYLRFSETTFLYFILWSGPTWDVATSEGKIRLWCIAGLMNCI